MVKGTRRMWYHRVMLIRECAFESLVKGLLCAEICEPCVRWQSYDIMCVSKCSGCWYECEQGYAM